MYSVNPEIDLTNLSHEDILEYNAPNSSYNTVTSTSYSDSRIGWSTMISGKQILGRAIQYTIPIAVNITGTTTGTLLCDDGYDALRSLPDLRIISNLAVTLNGQQVPVGGQYNEWCPDTQIHYNEVLRERHMLSYPDMSSAYSTMVGGMGNPLAGIENTENDEELQKRGAFMPKSVTLRDATHCNAIYELRGWVLVPGLFGPDQASNTGLLGITSLTVEMVLDLSSINVVSHALANSAGTASPTTISSVACTLSGAGAPTLTYKLIPIGGDTPVPPMLKYKFLRAQPYLTQNGTAVGAGNSSTITTQSMILDHVPKYCFLYIRENKNNKLISSTDTFATINNVSVNFNGLTGQLASASQTDLLQMAQDCGSRQSLVQFTGRARGPAWAARGTQGSLLCLEFGRHIPLNDPSIQVGTAGNYNLQFTINFTNNSETSMTLPTLYCVPFLKQYMDIKDNTVFFGLDDNSTGGIVLGGAYSLGQAINGKIPLQKAEYNSSYGGSWWGNAWNAIKSFAKNTKVLSEVAKTIPTVGAPISKAIASYGYGVEGGTTTIAPPKSGGATVTKAKLTSLISKL